MCGEAGWEGAGPPKAWPKGSPRVESGAMGIAHKRAAPSCSPRRPKDACVAGAKPSERGARVVRRVASGGIVLSGA